VGAVAAWLVDLDLRSPASVVRLLTDGAEANRTSRCRRGSVDEVEPAGELIATGDLHDNPAHLLGVVELADLDGAGAGPRHLTLHEVIHGGRLVQGMDLSHRALVRIAALKARFPEHVHTLLANHELSQIAGLGVIKDGLRMTEAFNEGVAYVFGGEAPEVLAAIGAFIRSMPLAMISGRGGPNGVLCAHSVPGPDLIERFDESVLDRELTEDDYAPRRGAAHIMVWGRAHTPGLLNHLAARWGAPLMVLGHEKAPDGWMVVPDRAVVLNTDHDRAAALRIDLASPPPVPLALDEPPPGLILLGKGEPG
jgi:hypothetical protein